MSKNLDLKTLQLLDSCVVKSVIDIPREEGRCASSRSL